MKYEYYSIQSVGLDEYRLILRSSQSDWIEVFTYIQEDKVDMKGWNKMRLSSYEIGHYKWKKYDWKVLKPILFAWMHEAFSAVTNEQRASES